GQLLRQAAGHAQLAGRDLLGHGGEVAVEERDGGGHRGSPSGPRTRTEDRGPSRPRAAAPATPPNPPWSSRVARPWTLAHRTAARSRVGTLGCQPSAWAATTRSTS